MVQSNLRPTEPLGKESIIQIEELVRKEVAMTQVHHDGYAKFELLGDIIHDRSLYEKI